MSDSYSGCSSLTWILPLLGWKWVSGVLKGFLQSWEELLLQCAPQVFLYVCVCVCCELKTGGKENGRCSEDAGELKKERNLFERFLIGKTSILISYQCPPFTPSFSPMKQSVQLTNIPSTTYAPLHLILFYLPRLYFCSWDRVGFVK